MNHKTEQILLAAVITVRKGFAHKLEATSQPDPHLDCRTMYVCIYVHMHESMNFHSG